MIEHHRTTTVTPKYQQQHTLPQGHLVWPSGKTPVTPNSGFTSRPLERAEDGMLRDNFEQVQSCGHPSPFR